MVEAGYYDLALPVQAELELLAMQARFHESTQFIKRYCTIDRTSDEVTSAKQEGSAITSSGSEGEHGRKAAAQPSVHKCRSIVDVQRSVVRNAQYGVQIFSKYQHDILDLKRFEWAKKRVENTQTMQALNHSIVEMQGEWKHHSATQHQLTSVRKQVGKKICKQQKEGKSRRVSRFDLFQMSCLLACTFPRVLDARVAL